MKYIGIDIFEDLVKKNTEKYGDEDRISFICKDIVDDELPNGDLCIIRQVLQHLDNASINRVLQKTRNYKYVLITEHRTIKEAAIDYNANIRTGQGTRVGIGSGLYFEEAPFNMHNEVVLRIPYESENRCIRQELVTCLFVND